MTRPREQARGLARRVEAAGGRSLLYPAIEIGEPADLPRVQQVVDGLAQAALAIFVSPAAVQKGMDLVSRRGGWPQSVRAAAVGAGSRRELEQRGVAQVLAPETGSDSEALLAMPQLAEVSGRRIVIFRGAGGRELLGETLAARGALVEYAECYRRLRPRTDMAPLLAEWDRGGVHAVTVFSAEALANLGALLGEAGQARLRTTPLFVPHRRIADEALKLGILEATVGGPGDEEMVARLVAYFRDAK